MQRAEAHIREGWKERFEVTNFTSQVNWEGCCPVGLQRARRPTDLKAALQSFDLTVLKTSRMKVQQEAHKSNTAAQVSEGRSLQLNGLIPGQAEMRKACQ